MGPFSELGVICDAFRLDLGDIKGVEAAPELPRQSLKVPCGSLSELLGIVLALFGPPWGLLGGNWGPLDSIWGALGGKKSPKTALKAPS